MRFLILDDVPARIEEFKKYLLPKDSFIHVTNVAAFRAAYSEQSFDLLILDHDLPLDTAFAEMNNEKVIFSENISHDRNGESGMDAIKFLIQCAPKDQKIHIWSQSFLAPIMLQKLKNAGFTNISQFPIERNPKFYYKLASIVGSQQGALAQPE